MLPSEDHVSFWFMIGSDEFIQTAEMQSRNPLPRSFGIIDKYLFLSADNDGINIVARLYPGYSIVRFSNQRPSCFTFDNTLGFDKLSSENK